MAISRTPPQVFQPTTEACNHPFAEHTGDKLNANMPCGNVRSGGNRKDLATGRYGNPRILVFRTAERELYFRARLP